MGELLSTSVQLGPVVDFIVQDWIFKGKHTHKAPLYAIQTLQPHLVATSGLEGITGRALKLITFASKLLRPIFI